MRTMVAAMVAIAVLLVTANIASAYYIPAEHLDEAQNNKGVVDWYNFGVKYSEEHWGLDILRQMAMNETNSGKITELHIVILKYIK